MNIKEYFEHIDNLNDDDFVEYMQRMGADEMADKRFKTTNEIFNSTKLSVDLVNNADTIFRTLSEKLELEYTQDFYGFAVGYATAYLLMVEMMKNQKVELPNLLKGGE